MPAGGVRVDEVTDENNLIAGILIVGFKAKFKISFLLKGAVQITDNENTPLFVA